MIRRITLPAPREGGEGVRLTLALDDEQLARLIWWTWVHGVVRA